MKENNLEWESVGWRGVESLYTTKEGILWRGYIVWDGNWIQEICRSLELAELQLTHIP